MCCKYQMERDVNQILWYSVFDEDGEYKLHVVISDSNANSNTFDYYIYVKKALSNAFYYFKDESYTDGYYGSPLK